jgi:DNA-binding IclR family transcriptional regulator
MSRPALAADRAIQVIDLLTLHPTERFNLTEITQRTGVNPASAHALMAVLLHAGYVQRHPTHKTYALGPALVAASAAALEQLPGIRAAQAEIGELSRELELEAVVTVATEDEIIVVGRALHASAYGSVLAVGQRLPLAPPFGSVFLAWSASAEIERWLARSEPALDARETEDQHRALELVRTRGYSLAFDSPARREVGEVVAHRATSVPADDHDHLDELVAALAHGGDYHVMALDESRTYDVSMIAAPVFDANQRVTAAITVCGFAPAMPATEVIRIGERVRGLALVITKRTHGRLPPGLD